MKPKVFIGSSSEGVEIANHLQPALQRGGVCEATVWSQGVFQPSSYTLPRLADRARSSDFAVLIATPDDTTIKRGEEAIAPRDNIILEFGIFVGALGLERVFLVTDTSRPLAMPSDISGLTWIPYDQRDDGNLAAAAGPVATEIRARIRELGPRLSSTTISAPGSDPDAQLLVTEIARISDNARAQGWKVRSNDTTLRLFPPGRRSFPFSYSITARESRIQLREFAALVRANGLRVNRSVRRPID